MIFIEWMGGKQKKFLEYFDLSVNEVMEVN